LVDLDRYTGHKRNIYDLNWTLQPWTIKYESSNQSVPKPKKFAEMVALATALSCGFPHVRVDLYNLNGKIYFGEMTFASGSGIEPFTPPEYNEMLGALWVLPERERI
jgi:hypothetical protein